MSVFTLAMHRSSRRTVAALALATLMVLGGLGWLALSTRKPLPAGPHATTPVHCGDTITHSIIVGNDLTCTGVDAHNGLIVGADSITINLNGHAFAGDDSLNFDGIQDVAHTGVTITNGSVHDFALGVVISNGSANHVSAIRAYSNQLGGIDVTSPGSSVASSLTFLNGQDGIDVAFNNVLVTNNTSRENSAYGIVVDGGAYTGVVVASNRALNNTADGIIDNGSGTHLTSNIVQKNGENGIDSVPDHTAVIKTNTANYNNTANASATGGIKAYAGTVDGGGNAAKDNQGFQCDNVVCV